LKINIAFRKFLVDLPCDVSLCSPYQPQQEENKSPHFRRLQTLPRKLLIPDDGPMPRVLSCIDDAERACGASGIFLEFFQGPVATTKVFTLHFSLGIFQQERRDHDSTE
jgi:hypothetical protein